MQALPDNCKFIFDILENNGFECYAVGGCVRDIILGTAPHDIDFTTNATPDEILECFKNFKTLELGKKYGTIAVINDKDVFEITTYRVDGKYSDSRHPDGVVFSRNLKDDLSRRDFTVNAMAMDNNGNIIDLFRGKADLSNKIIRTVGLPEERFTEDALRMFRALRFSAKLGFEIEKETSNAIKTLCELITNVHPQRLRDEFEAFILSDNCTNIMSEYKEIFAYIIPELKTTFNYKQITPHHRYDVFNHTLKAIEHSPKDLEIRLTLLLHDIAKPLCVTTDKAGISHFKGHPAKSADIAAEILKRFAFPGEVVNKVSLLIKFHDNRFEKPSIHIKKILSFLSESDIIKLLTVQRCDILAQSEYKRAEKLEHIDYVESELKRIIKEKPCFRLSDLKVNGYDIASIGAKGKEIGEILEKLLELVIEEKLQNEKEVLINYAKTYIDK